MRFYTAYFPKPDELPENLKDDSFRLGDLKLIDGIEVETETRTVLLGNNSGRLARLPLSRTKTPEIDKGHVFSGEFGADGDQTVLEFSPTTTPRHVTKEAVPILLRVKLFCAQGSATEGFYRVIAEPVQMVLEGEGVTKTDDNRRIFWKDILFVVRQGSILQIRPAGSSPTKDYVVRYTDIGINFFTLEDYLSLPV